MPFPCPVSAAAMSMDTPQSAPQDATAIAVEGEGASPALRTAQSYTASAHAQLLNRVGRVISDIAAERTVTDDEIRQHALDCAWLMERAHDRFTQHGNPADRDEAVLWMHRQHEALRSLSPAWKAAREAEINRRISETA